MYLVVYKSFLKSQYKSNKICDIYFLYTLFLKKKIYFPSRFKDIYFTFLIFTYSFAYLFLTITKRTLSFVNVTIFLWIFINLYVELPRWMSMVAIFPMTVLIFKSYFFQRSCRRMSFSCIQNAHIASIIREQSSSVSFSIVCLSRM